MKVTMKSLFSNTEHTLDIPNLTEDQFFDWKHGNGNIQDVLGHLTVDEREFLLTGAVGSEWDDEFEDL